MTVKSRSPRWLTFSCRTMLLVVTLVAVFLAGRASQFKELRDAEQRSTRLAEQCASLRAELRKARSMVVVAFNPPGTMQPDEHGFLRDATGRPIGTWGVDLNIEATMQPR